jgi:tripartite-type tricarboxylate transporter receptor subunit TctC
MIEASAASRRRLAGLVLVAGSIACSIAFSIPSATSVRAENYPDRPIRLVIPFSAGGPNDLIARPLADKMSEVLGQPFVIESKAGANGIIGTTFVAKAPPDGYTMLMTTGSFTANPAVEAKTSYDALADFAPVTLLAQSYGLALMTRPDFPARTLLEFVDLARRDPGKFSYGHAGVGNATYVAAELFQKLAGIELLKVPYRGTSSFVPDIMSGHVDVSFMSTLVATPNANSGLLRALALSGSQRAPSLPDVPTFQELGFKEMDVTGYFGLWFPAGTPRDRVALINREAVKALQAPLLRRVLADSGLRSVGSNPEEFARFLEKDLEWQKDIVKRIGLTPQ